MWTLQMCIALLKATLMGMVHANIDTRVCASKTLGLILIISNNNTRRSNGLSLWYSSSMYVMVISSCPCSGGMNGDECTLG